MNSTDSLQATVALLRDLCRQLQSLSDDQIAQVLDGHARLEVRVKARKKLQTSKRAQLTHEELLDLAATLRSCQTREEGNSFLDQKISSKEDTTRLARVLDVPVQKTDTMEQIRARIIESTIGFRIRSAAVQGVLPGAPERSQTN
jgi:hypothetical protein